MSSSVLADIPSTQFNEDLAFDGTSVWHTNFSLGQIRELDPNNLGGAALNVFNLNFGVVGATFAAGQIWITNWGAQQVGTWDPNTNIFTSVFTVSSNAGGLAYDSNSGVLWVGQQGGLVSPFDLTGASLGAGFQPFGNISATIDGLAFAPIPEPGAVMVFGFGLLTVAVAGRKRRNS